MAAETRQPQFPLVLCLAAIVWTSLGIIAALLNIRWGASPAPGDGLTVAWIYVSVMTMFAWLLLWPAITKSIRAPLAWQALAIFCGSIPANGISFVVANAPTHTLWPTLMLHLSAAAFVFGVLSGSRRWPLLALLPPTAALVLPVAAFVAGETLSPAWWKLEHAAPAIAVARAATGMNAIASLITAALYMLLGFLAWLFSPGHNPIRTERPQSL